MKKRRFAFCEKIVCHLDVRKMWSNLVQENKKCCKNAFWTFWVKIEPN